MKKKVTAKTEVISKGFAKKAEVSKEGQGSLEISQVLTKKDRVYATGRRKTATARVWMAKGNGKFIVNGKAIDQYLRRPVLRMIVNQPFATTNTLGLFDVWCTVEGSGHSGQAGAIRHGVSRALVAANSDLHPILKHGKFLTRDSRRVERKKYGRKKARRSFQFSKR